MPRGSRDSYLKEGCSKSCGSKLVPVGFLGDVLIGPPADKTNGFNRHTSTIKEKPFSSTPLIDTKHAPFLNANARDNNHPGEGQLPVLETKVVDNDFLVLLGVVTHDKGTVAETGDHESESPHKVLVLKDIDFEGRWDTNKEADCQ